FELAQKVTRAMVSARKAVAIFEEQPPWPDRAESTPLPQHADLYDELTGFTARDRDLTIVVCAVPEETAPLADPGRSGSPSGLASPRSTRSWPTASGASASAVSTSALPRSTMCASRS